MVERHHQNQGLSGAENEPLEPEYDVDALHAPILREKVEPTEGREPLSVGLVVLFFALIGWGGWYLGQYGADFNPNILESVDLGKARPAASEAPPEDPGARGKRLYNFCNACHQADAKGVPGQYPPLAGSERLTGPPEVPIRIVLDGFGGKIVAQGKTYDSQMPAFRDRLSDQQIAAVLTHERANFGNDAPAISAEVVARVREQTAGRSGAWTAAELDALAKPPSGEGRKAP